MPTDLEPENGYDDVAYEEWVAGELRRWGALEDDLAEPLPGPEYGSCIFRLADGRPAVFDGVPW